MTIEPISTPNECHVLPSFIITQGQHEDGTPAAAWLVTLQWFSWGFAFGFGCELGEPDEEP